MRTKQENRGGHLRRISKLILFLSSGWRTYKEISSELEYKSKAYTTKDKKGHSHTTSYHSARNIVKVMEEAGFPIEFRYIEEGNNKLQKMRLPVDWVERCKWLSKYIGGKRK